MMSHNIFIDFDGVVSNTIETIVRLYDEDYSSRPEYRQVPWVDVNSWDFKELNCATPEEINEYFKHMRFFENIVLMPNVEYALNKISEKYDTYIVSMGNNENLFLKRLWLSVYSGFKNIQFIGCNFADYSDKRHIDMSGGIFIDDLGENLETSNADTKICFGDIYPWNKNWKGQRCYNWYETLRYLGLEE